jgi:hypothetical protein
MKKSLLFLLIPLLICNIGWVQVPGKFNYQAVIRNNTGELITEQNVDIQISLLNDTPEGNLLYQESHSKLTNTYGIVNLVIGDGTDKMGDLLQINWGQGDKYLKVEVDAGSGLTNLGTIQLLSVPYSLFAETADSARVANMAYSANMADVLGSNGVYSTSTDTLFVVKDHSGNVVFAVFPDGAQVIVNEAAKGKVGGFAVSGRSPSKAVDVDILKITQDSTRIYVNDTVNAKGKVGGFAVSGRSPSKSASTDILFVTADSTRIFVNDDPTVKGKVGGFAVSGRSPSKGVTNDYLQVTRDSTRVYVTESTAKGKVGGFAVSGRSPSKGTSQHMFVTTTDSTRIFTQDTVGGFGVRDITGGTSTSYLQLSPLNYFIGHESGELVEQDALNPGMGKYNTFFGYKAGQNTVNGFKNIFLGYKAGNGNVGGGWNIFIGNEAGYSSTGGLSNIFIGDQAGYNFANGVQNVFIGNEAGYSSSVSVYNNLFVGNGAGRNNVSGNYNTYIGISSGRNTTGSDNAFVGNLTGFSNTGSQNTYIGAESGIYTSVGNKNVYVGYRAGYRSYGTRNVFVGTNANNTNFSSVNYNNCIAIGDSVIVTGHNQIRIGNSEAASFYAQGIYNSTTGSAANMYIASNGRIYVNTSSKRYKKDITPLEINTSNIYKLNPVSYTSLSDNKRYFGLIAEEVADVIPELAEFAIEKNVVPGSSSEELIPNAVHYPILSVLLLKEVQKHEATINHQQELIDVLKNQNLELKDRLTRLEELVNKLNK